MVSSLRDLDPPNISVPNTYVLGFHMSRFRRSIGKSFEPRLMHSRWADALFGMLASPSPHILGI